MIVCPFSLAAKSEQEIKNSLARLLRMKPIHFVITILGIGIVANTFGQHALARPIYNAIMEHQYGLREDKIARASSCLYCHTDLEASDWNPFGLELKNIFNKEAGRRVPESLYLVLKLDKDSDKDGYKDVLEVFAKTLPGDPESKPEDSAEDLEAQLEVEGGVDLFKPVNAR
jgi:hypothetical protein